MLLDEKKIVILGGSSGIGLGIAKVAVDAGGEVLIASRSIQKLESAKKQLGDNAQFCSVDLADEQSIADLMAEAGAFDHLVVTGGQTTSGAFLELALNIAKEDFEINFWGKYNAAKYGAAQIRAGGSITFISGVYSRKPNANAVVTAASVSATESLGRALAVALSPTRVNTIAPGLVDTPMIMPEVPEDERTRILENIGDSLPGKTIGKPEDIAQMALMVMTNRFLTGSTLFIDGGYTII